METTTQEIAEVAVHCGQTMRRLKDRVASFACDECGATAHRGRIYPTALRFSDGDEFTMGGKILTQDSRGDQREARVIYVTRFTDRPGWMTYTYAGVQTGQGSFDVDDHANIKVGSFVYAVEEG